MATSNQLPNQVSSLQINPALATPGGGGTVIGAGAEHYTVDFPINEMEVLIALPVSYYTAVPPFVMAMVNGGVTEIMVAGVMEDVPFYGMVYTKVKFNFTELAVGKRCHAWLVGGV